MDVLAAQQPSGVDAEDVFDARYEYSAPRFYDFEKGSPDDEDEPDEWFGTAATTALGTPEEAYREAPNHGQLMAEVSAEAQAKAPPPASKSQTSTAELEQVRAVLAHLTGNTANKPLAAHAAAKPVTRAAQEARPEPHLLVAEPAPMVPRAPAAAGPSRAAARPPAATAVQQPAAPRATAAPPRQAPAAPTAPAPSRPITRAAAVKPAPPPPRRRAPAPRHAPRITVPHSPLLMSKHRSAMHQRQLKSSEEMEMEEVARGKKQAAAMRQRNARSLGAALGGGAAAAPSRAQPAKRALTEPQEPQLRTAKRQRVHGMGTRATTPLPRARPQAAAAPKARAPPRPAPRRPQLTLARTPQFATTARARTSRYKPSEQEEVDQMAAQRKFKARPVSRRVMEGRPAAAPRRPEPRPLTAPAPFRFATDARAAQRAKPPADLPPASFTFATDGVVTRSRARVATTAAPRAAPAPAPARAAPDEDASSAGGSSGGSGGVGRMFALGKRRRTTAGPVLLGLGGARRVLAAPADEEGEADEVQEHDGMQAIIRGGAGDRTTLHNPLFRAA